MPRTKKVAGTAVDRRNGRRAEVSASSLGEFLLPPRDPPWRPETELTWALLWSDPVARALTPVDRPILLRWADSIDRAALHLEQGDADPIAKGSMGQSVESPHYGIADKAIKVAQACEAQIGVGALNRARLGIALISERASLADLNARVMGNVVAGTVEDDEIDPRLS